MNKAWKKRKRMMSEYMKVASVGEMLSYLAMAITELDARVEGIRDKEK